VYRGPSLAEGVRVSEDEDGIGMTASLSAATTISQETASVAARRECSKRMLEEMM
jgi:hypothetical protein